MKPTAFPTLSILLGVCFMWAGAARANLIVNGSFEAEDYSDSPYGQVWNPGTGPSGWTQSINQGVSLYNVDAANHEVFPLPQFGSQFYYVGQSGSHATVAQSVGLNAGQSYLLSFYFSPLANDQPASLDLTITGGSQTLLAGLTYDYTQAASTSPLWQLATYAFTATETEDYLFAFTSQGGGNAVVIDNVVLVIPEPATTAAAIGALAFGAMFIRRRFGRRA